MTIERDNVVRLSSRDWISIVGIVVAVSSGVLAAFIHHDRLLMRVVTQQESLSDRLAKIEAKIEVSRN
jgi:hypothetical protein